MLQRLNVFKFTEQFIQEGIAFIQSDRVIYPPHIIYPSQQQLFFQRYEGFEVKNENFTILDISPL